MTTEEAKKVAEIATEADSGCPTCVDALFDLLREAFPEHGDVFDEVWDKFFDFSDEDV